MSARAKLRALVALLGLAAACRPEPARPVVDTLSIQGLHANEDEPLREGLATTETPRLFGFKGILEYATYDPHVLSRDLLRIERYLRARGYYQAKVTAARVIDLGKNRVRIELRVDEGLPVHISRIRPGLATLPPDVVLPANRARHQQEGDIFDEDRFEADKRRILTALLDRGYAFAKVSAKARVNVAARTAEIDYTIEPGALARYGPVSFVGLREIPEGPVRDALKIREGRRFSEADLEDARGELLDLGVFSTVEIVPDRTHPERPVVPIEVRVREAALRTLRLGGGVRFDVLQLQSRLETGWEHRNSLGGMRTFSVNARPGLTFYPTRIGELTPPTRLLPELRVITKLTQPSFLEGRTTGTLSAAYNVAPVLYPLPEDADPKQERIIGYQEVAVRGAVNRRFFRRRLILEPSYNWQANFPFTYQQEKPQGLGDVLVSFPEFFLALDLRDDPIRTHSGLYVASAVQAAGYGFGTGKRWIRDIKVNPEFRAFVPLDRATLGLRLNVGFLFPGNYGESLEQPNPTEITPEFIYDQQKLNLRAFYSGGPNSNRGYPYRTVGPHGPIGYLAPTTDRNCMNFETDDRCLRPLGGLTLWEASIEARVPFSRGSPIEAVLFVDASDLRRAVASIRFTAPHLSPGVGLRYVTPVGPIRLDVGWRVPGLQAFGDDDNPETVGRPGDPLFGFFPGAINLLFGSEAF